MKIICTKEEQEKLVKILCNTLETFTSSIIEWEIIDDKGMCYNCQYKSASCQEGLHCIRDSEED